jgi:hypothetical protein
MLKSLREFIGGPLAVVAGLVSAVLIAVAAVKFFGKHSQDAWMWLFFGAVALVLFSFWRYHEMRQQRDSAVHEGSISPTMVHMGEGVQVPGTLSMSQFEMNIGSGSGVRMRDTKRRWLARILDDGERDDLATRCEACSREALEFLHRPSPRAPQAGQDWTAYDNACNAFREETEERFPADFVPRIRGLLTECAEAGYSFEPKIERFRVEGDIGWHDRDRLASEIGVVGRRVRRGAKRLPK